MTPLDAPEAVFRGMPLFDAPAPPASGGQAARHHRLRTRFLRAGREAVDDREQLELLLSGCHPARVARALAETLLDSFGSSARILAACPERLHTVPGLSDAGVAIIQTAEALGIRLARAEVPDQVRPTYARRGTGFNTRLTVIERSAEPGIAINREARAAEAGELLDAVIASAPARLPVESVPIPTGPGRDLFGKAVAPTPTKHRTGARAAAPQTSQVHDWGPVGELAVEAGPAGPAEPDTTDTSTATTGPYAPWRPGVVRVPGAVEHPTPLVQSTAMAAVPHPVPSYRPMLPVRVLTDSLLSGAQLESIALAGEAHKANALLRSRLAPTSNWSTQRSTTKRCC